MIRIQEAILVEGKYDKIKLSSLVDGLIIETRGFRIFRDSQQMEWIRSLAKTRGILIFTDSDGAGFVIRNYLRGAVPEGRVKHAYIPDIFGKEKRKAKPSKEGKLGVEGISPSLLLEALRRAGATIVSDTGKASQIGRGEGNISKADFFSVGLSGGEESAKRRKQLLQHLHLPERLSTNALLQFLNETLSREEFFQLARDMFAEN